MNTFSLPKNFPTTGEKGTIYKISHIYKIFHTKIFLNWFQFKTRKYSINLKEYVIINWKKFDLIQKSWRFSKGRFQQHLFSLPNQLYWLFNLGNSLILFKESRTVFFANQSGNLLHLFLFFSRCPGLSKDK